LDGRFGFVVYIDILGTTEGHQDYEERFQDFRTAITDKFDSTYWGGKGLAIRGLSDSVFFILQLSDNIPPSPVNYRNLEYGLVEEFFESLVALQGRCLEDKNPLRGGVTIGITKVEPRSQIIDFIGGVAISDAVKIEESLKMCGIALVPKSMLELDLHDVFDRYTNRLMRKGLIKHFDVPTVHGLVKSYCLSWPDGFNLNEICTRFGRYMPRHRSDTHQGRDFKKAAKYFAAARVLNTECYAQED
jgi:hypothetical protein